MLHSFRFAVFCAAVLFALTFSLTDATAGESNAEAAKRIYDWAQSLKDTFTYTASGASENNRNATYFKQANPDGTTYSKTVFDNSYGPSTYLTNETGEYRIIGNTAVKSTFVRVAQWPNYDDYASFSMQEGKYQGVPCYVIRKQFPDNDFFFQAFVRRLPEEDKKGKSEVELRSLFLAAVSPIEIYYIDHSNGFIYSHQLYSGGGKIKLALSYTNVIFVERLPEETFDLPAGVAISIANDWDEYISKTTDASIERFNKNNRTLPKKSDSWFIKAGNYLRRKSDVLISLFTWAFIALSVASFGILMYIKIYPKRSSLPKNIPKRIFK